MLAFTVETLLVAHLVLAWWRNRCRRCIHGCYWYVRILSSKPSLTWSHHSYFRVSLLGDSCVNSQLIRLIPVYREYVKSMKVPYKCSHRSAESSLRLLAFVMGLRLGQLVLLLCLEWCTSWVCTSNTFSWFDPSCGHKAPIAWPIAKLLDYVLGANEAHTYKKAELKTFLQFHKTGEEPLRDDEINILNVSLIYVDEELS